MVWRVLLHVEPGMEPRMEPRMESWVGYGVEPWSLRVEAWSLCSTSHSARNKGCRSDECRDEPELFQHGVPPLQGGGLFAPRRELLVTKLPMSTDLCES